MSDSQSVTGELKRLVKQSSQYLTATVVNLGLGFISFPILTRVFSVADFGLIDLVQKVFLLLTATSKLGQQNSALRFFSRETFEKDPEQSRRYYSTMYLGVMGMGLVVTGLFAAIVWALPATILMPSLSSLLLFASALILLRAVQSILWSFLRIEERTGIYNVANVLLRAATIGALLFLLPRMGASAHTYFTATMGVEILIVTALTIPLITRGVLSLGSFDLTLFKAAILFGSPLVVQELAGIILDSGDRILVQIYLGADALGFYSVAYGLSSYVNTLLAAPLGLAILPIYLRIWNSQGREKTIEFLSVGLDFFLMVSALILAVVTVTAHDAVLLLASSKYKGADVLIPTLVAGLLVYTSQIFITAGLVIEKKTRPLAATLLYSALLNILLNMVLLPLIGLQGAAIATLISYVFCAIYQSRISFRVLPLMIEYRSVLNYVLAAIGAWGAGAAATFSRPAFSFFGKATVASGVYLILLLILDRRFRQRAAIAWQSVQSALFLNRNTLEAQS